MTSGRSLAGFAGSHPHQGDQSEAVNTKPGCRAIYAERYQHTKRRLGRQRGPKVAQIELSRKLTEAIWHMLTRNQPFAPAGAGFRLAA